MCVKVADRPSVISEKTPPMTGRAWNPFATRDGVVPVGEGHARGDVSAKL